MKTSKFYRIRFVDKLLFEHYTLEFFERFWRCSQSELFVIDFEGLKLSANDNNSQNTRSHR